MSESQNLPELLQAKSKEIKTLAGNAASASKLIQLVCAASRSPALRECTVDSVVGFCLKCAETGLTTLGPGGAWPVPFRNKKNGTMECQFIPDWRGLIDLAIRDKKIVHGYADIVRQGDEFVYEKGAEPKLKHVPAPGLQRPVIAAYAVFVLTNGMKHIECMWREELDAVQARAKSEAGPWKTDPDEMRKKTVVKRGAKVFQGSGSERLSKAVEYDNQATGYAGLNLPVLEAPKARAALPVTGKVGPATAAPTEGQPPETMEEPPSTVPSKEAPKPELQVPDTEEPVEGKTAQINWVVNAAAWVAEVDNKQPSDCLVAWSVFKDKEDKEHSFKSASEMMRAKSERWVSFTFKNAREAVKGLKEILQGEKH